MKIFSLSLLGLSLVFISCSQPRPKVASKQYPLTGKVVSIDLKEKTAAVDAAAIPNFMDAMKMDYPISSPADLSALRVGENISAVVNVSEDGVYSLSSIHESSAPGAGK